MANSSSPDKITSLVSFEIHQPEFRSILGPLPSIELIAEEPNGLPLYHEACIYDQPSQSVIITSSPIPASSFDSNASSTDNIIKLSRVYDPSSTTSSSSVRVEDVSPPSLIMANGGVNYGSGVIVCAQGDKSSTGASSLIHIPDLSQPHLCHTLLSDFHSRAFNSVNDVIVHPQDGTIWFTDPCYGYHQGFRPPPELPNQVYRFDPKTKIVRAIADDFDRPNGLCFSPDLKTLYVTDTGAISGAPDKPLDPAGKSHIYAFDITTPTSDVTQPILTNRRLFAYAPGLLPDGIKCDTAGNVYSGCMDGVEVWNAGGVLIGTIKVEGGVANFCFGEKGTLYMCNETRLWKARLDSDRVRGALLGI